VKTPKLPDSKNSKIS